MKKAILLMCALLVSLGLTGCSTTSTTDTQTATMAANLNVSAGPTVATYTGGTITQSEFDAYFKAYGFFYPTIITPEKLNDLRELALKELFVYKVVVARSQSTPSIASAAKNRALAWNDEYTELMKNGEIAKNMNTQLQKFNMTMPEAVAHREKIELLIAYAASTIKEDEVKAAYEKDKKYYAVVGEVAHIYVGKMTIDGKERPAGEAKKKIDEAAAALKAGKSFGEVAAQYSEDPTTKNSGGLIQLKDISQWGEDFGDRTYTEPVGQNSDVFETAMGYEIINVGGRQEKPFDEIKFDLLTAMAEEKAAKFKETLPTELNFKSTLPKVTANQTETNAAPTIAPPATEQK